MRRVYIIGYYSSFPTAIPLCKAGYSRVTHPSATNPLKIIPKKSVKLHRSTCMCYARRQRLSWARIKLSYIVCYENLSSSFVLGHSVEGPLGAGQANSDSFIYIWLISNAWFKFCYPLFQKNFRLCYCLFNLIGSISSRRLLYNTTDFYLCQIISWKN